MALNPILSGPAPLGFHLVNVFLHAVVSLLLWRGLRVWGMPILSAALAALLFAVNPLHTEVIDQVVGRSELLTALFLLVAFNLARSRWKYSSVLVCFCYLPALLAKNIPSTDIRLVVICQSGQVVYAKNLIV